MKIKWELKRFDALSLEELYQILLERQRVFVVEQDCPYMDADDKDQDSLHLIGKTANHHISAYARLLPAGLTFKEMSIGRILTSQDARGSGAGKELLNKSIAFLEQQFGTGPIRIGAQCYLIKFYQSFGFVVDSPEYLEDGIPHVEMLRK